MPAPRSAQDSASTRRLARTTQKRAAASRLRQAEVRGSSGPSTSSRSTNRWRASSSPFDHGQQLGQFGLDFLPPALRSVARPLHPSESHQATGLRRVGDLTQQSGRFGGAAIVDEQRRQRRHRSSIVRLDLQSSPQGALGSPAAIRLSTSVTSGVGANAARTRARRPRPGPLGSRRRPGRPPWRRPPESTEPGTPGQPLGSSRCRPWPTRRRRWCPRTAFSSSGVSCRHGSHQEAQRSTITERSGSGPPLGLGRWCR